MSDQEEGLKEKISLPSETDVKEGVEENPPAEDDKKETQSEPLTVTAVSEEEKEDTVVQSERADESQPDAPLQNEPSEKDSSTPESSQVKDDEPEEPISSKPSEELLEQVAETLKGDSAIGSEAVFPDSEISPDVTEIRQPDNTQHPLPSTTPFPQDPLFPEIETSPDVVEVREPPKEEEKPESFPATLDPTIQPLLPPPNSRDTDSPAAETPVERGSRKFSYPPTRPPKTVLDQASEDKLFEIPKEEVMPDRALLTPKKQVSILVNRPPSEEDIPYHKRLEHHPPLSPRELSYDEKSPLLACSSLPTVVGYDELPIHTEETPFLIENPMSSTRSEGGHPPVRRKRRRRRFRSEMDVIPQIKPRRPLIASPFMPIVVNQRSVDLDRRSLVGAPQRVYETRPNRGTSYGSMRRAEEPSKEESSEEDESESEESSELEPRRAASFGSLTSRDWVTVVMLAVSNLCSTVAFSCIAPFYPQEATLKGMTESETGLVFGVFELVMFITAPLFGKYMTRIGSKNMFTLGLAITGITAICFGFLNYLPSGRLFFWASLLIRVAEAFGDAAFVTSSFAISAKCFPGSIATIVGIMETFAGLGYTAGPLIGGFLYEFGGFQTPFLVLGGILLFATALSMWLIEAPEDEEDCEGDKGMFAMLKIPVIWIMYYAVVVCAISLSFLDPTLEAHLRTFSLSPTVVGLMFLLCGGIYTLSAPVWGVLIDKWHCSVEIMFFGSIATAVSMLIIGPTPLLPFDKDLVMIGISLSILGLAAGALYIPTFQNCLDAVKEHDFDDSIYTYGCVSGIFQSAFAFGGFIGPTLGGLSVQWIGFEWTTTAIAGINAIFILTLIIFYGARRCRGPVMKNLAYT